MKFKAQRTEIPRVKVAFIAHHAPSLLDAVGDGEAAGQRLIMLHLTLLTFVELAEGGEKFGGTAKAHQDFPQSITADSIKGLGQ